MSETKKRHHYVPVAYLRSFTGADGRIWAYRKDEPEKPLHVQPAAIAFERYYYSQPLEDGNRDNNTIEDFFSELEGEWPPLVSRLEAGTAAGDDIGILHEFLMLMRVRVPAARDMIELSLAEMVKATARVMDRAGALPPKPEGMEDILDNLEVAIDPHRSILAMPALVQALGQLFEMVGLQVVHNETEIDFITSDNPVVWFDPLVPEDRMLPYLVDHTTRRVELLFPLTSRLLLRGHSELRGARGLKHEYSVGSETYQPDQCTLRLSFRLCKQRYLWRAREKVCCHIPNHADDKRSREHRRIRGPRGCVRAAGGEEEVERPVTVSVRREENSECRGSYAEDAPLEWLAPAGTALIMNSKARNSAAPAKACLK